MGEPGGVGVELAVKAWQALHKTGPVFFMIGGDSQASACGSSVKEIRRPNEAAADFASALPVLAIENDLHATPGEAAPANAPAILESIMRAVQLALDR